MARRRTVDTRGWCAVGVVSCALAAGVAGAQVRLPTEQEVAAIARRLPSVGEQDVARARRQVSPSPPAAPGGQGTARASDLSRLPQPLPGGAPDIAALARGYRETVAAQAADGAAFGPRLLVFISFSMPEGSIRRLAQQGARAGAVLVLRGLDGGSLARTVARARHAVGEQARILQIDPQAFDRFGVRAVPSIVLVREGVQPGACGKGACVPLDAYVMVTGDVTLDVALREAVRRAPAMAGAAHSLLRRLEE